MARLIKRYGNRKLYDTQASRYVTLDGIADLVRHGDDVRIIDNDSGTDLTAVTFAQIIFEEEKRKNGVLGLPLLRRLIERGGEAVHEILSSVDRGREALGELAEKGMRQLAQGSGKAAGTGRRTEGKSLLNEILEVPQKQLEQLQQRIDAQVRASIERVATHPAVQTELNRIEENVRALEHQLRRLRRRQGKPAAARRGRANAGHRAAPRTKIGPDRGL